MASTDNSFVRSWFLIIDDDIPENLRPDYESTVSEIQNSLDSEGSWKDYGYVFKNICRTCGESLRRNKRNWKHCIEVHLTLPENIVKICGLPNNLSCANMSDNIIYFNLSRWLYGSRESGLSHKSYLRYVCRHEFGHLLGRGHIKPRRGELCPIMYQQTISDGSCIPNTNVLPFE